MFSWDAHRWQIRNLGEGMNQPDFIPEIIAATLVGLVPLAGFAAMVTVMAEKVIDWRAARKQAKVDKERARWIK